MQPSTNDHKLAKVLLNHSLHIQPKEKVLISASDMASFPLVKAVFIEALKLGAYPVAETEMNYQFGRSNSHGLAYQFYKYANEWQLNYTPHELLEAQVQWSDAFVRIVTLDNTKELSQIPQEKIITHNRATRPYLEKIVDKDRWVLTYYPTLSMAQEAGVSFDWLTDFYFRSCLVDYEKMEKNLSKLEKVLDDGSQVKIVGKDTNLTFSIKERSAKASSGERNIPDGEVFLAPVHETVEGYIYFEFPTEYNHVEMSGIRLEFKKGKVIKAKSQTGNANLQKILNTDPGARYLGELGVGANFQIKNFMKSTIFDEKIGGTVHLALGRSYRELRGGAPVAHNESIIHWDIVKDMRKKDSVLFVDDKPILKEGKFTV